MKLSISPCPNDTFMFDALLHGRVDTGGMAFDPLFEDIEQLNRHAIEGIPDITKISYAIYPLISGRYRLLTAGSALGRGNGPVLVGREKRTPQEIAPLKIAIPGEHTTAALLLKSLYGGNLDCRSYLFSDIAGAVAGGEVDAGVLIHEGRFVFHEKGLHKIADLGQEWERSTGLPVPLGAIAVKRELGAQTHQKINDALRRSIAFAFENPASGRNFVSSHARELSEEVIRAHIETFVNGFSLDVGAEGRAAVEKLLAVSGAGFDKNDIFV